MNKTLAWLFIATISTFANAGEISLNNGDRLSGELVKIEGGKVYWKSESTGEVSVNLESVRSLNSSTQIQVGELAGPCVISSGNDQNLNYQCSDGTTGTLARPAIVSLNAYVDPNVVPVSYKGKLIAAGRRSSGNKEERSWSIDSEANYRRGDKRHQAKIDFDSLDNDSSDTGDKLVLRYGYDWFFKERWYWFNSVQGSYDEPADIESRYQLGTGLGFQVWDTKESALSLETGLSYIEESLEDPLIPDPNFEDSSSYAAWQWSLDYRRKLFGDAEIFHKHQFNKSLEESEDWDLETETGLSAPLVGTVYGQIKIDYDVKNSPAAGKRREDTQINIGVGYNW